jgi:hypothetical protein
LPGEILRAIGELADDAAGHLPLGAIPILLNRQLVRVPLGRFFFADPGTLVFGHGSQPSGMRFNLQIGLSAFKPHRKNRPTISSDAGAGLQAEKNVSGAPMMTTAEF